MDMIEQQLLMNQAQRKSPVLAAILGFFFPWAAAFYNGKILAGLVLLVMEVLLFAMSFAVIGVPFLLLFAIYGAFQNHKWAQQTNQKALARLVEERRQAQTSGARLA